MRRRSQLIFMFSVEMGFCHVGQADLKLLTSGDPPASASQSAGITGVSCGTLGFKMDSPASQETLQSLANRDSCCLLLAWTCLNSCLKVNTIKL